MTEQHKRHTPHGVVRYGPYPELTVPAVLVGYAIGAVITVSIGYASLVLGFSIEGSELAAILGFGILRGAMRRTSIVENNINQTIASSVNGASAGMMFSIPALFILGYTDFDPYLMVLGCIAGGVLGIAFIIPLRKQMIDFNRLSYPGGVAVATILRSPGAGMRKAIWLLAGAGLSAVLQVCAILADDTVSGNWLVDKLAAIPEYWNLGAHIGLPEYMNGIWYVSLMTVGVGYIAGRGGVYFIVGGFVCYWLLAPILSATGQLPMADPEEMRKTIFRPVGIGMLVGGALTGIVLALPLVIGAVRSMQTAAKSGARHSRDELPIRFLYVAVIGAFFVLLLISMQNAEELGIGRGVLMAILGTLWIWVAGVVLSECIGRTNWSPLSGMTLIGITILIAAASLGNDANDTVVTVASIAVGAAMCVAMAQATDLMMDLKTGYLVGASPRKQQIGQFLGTWLGPILVMVLIYYLHEAYGMGSKKLPAPQGRALAAVIEGILREDVPLAKYGAGAGLGALLSASGVGGLGVLVGLGFYLPFDIVLTYTIGTVLRLVTDRWPGKGFADSAGIPLAAGFIVGEALVGVGNAIYRIAAAGGGP